MQLFFLEMDIGILESSPTDFRKSSSLNLVIQLLEKHLLEGFVPRQN